MIGVVSTLHVFPDKVEEFESLARALQAKVRAEEPGCTAYHATRNRTDPTVFHNVEFFVDQAALDAHFASPHLQEAAAQMGPLLSAPPEATYFETL